VLNKSLGTETLVAWLVVADGPLRGEDFRLPGGTVRLGHNADCEVCLTGDTFVSSQHAEVRFQGGGYWVHDLNSTNGLFVNGTRVTQAELAEGDQIKVGTTMIIFTSVKI
jgi:pSer/pThr/pTyr-binding forkhead associated (FHA) protein